MSLINKPGSNVTVQTDLYEGPLDLLLDLISKAELEITSLSLAKVTNQYLAHLENIQQRSAVEVSGFLVVAAKLIQIKSEALLPRPPERAEDEEDPAESLARQLRIYKKIKQTAGWLQSLEDQGNHSYIRLASPPVIEDDLDLGDITIKDLIAYLEALYHYEEDAAPITTVVAIPKVTIKNKIRELLHHLRKENHLSYRTLLPKNHDRIEAIVLFLAILELIKQQFAKAEQQSLFADINISATDKISLNEEIKLALEE